MDEQAQGVRDLEHGTRFHPESGNIFMHGALAGLAGTTHYHSLVVIEHDSTVHLGVIHFCF